MDGNGQPLTKAEFLEVMDQLRKEMGELRESTGVRRNSFDKSANDFKKHFDRRMDDLEMPLLAEFANCASMSVAIWPPDRAIPN